MLLKLLKLDNYYGVSKTVDIAKGKNKLPTTLKKGLDQIKRNARS